MADFLKEIQNEIKEERYERLLIHHGPKLIIIAVFIVVGTFFYSFYKKQQYIGNSEAGNLFYDAYVTSKPELYDGVFKKEHAGFNALSNLQLAGINQSNDKYKEAEKNLKSILSDKNADKAISELAELDSNYIILKDEAADKKDTEASLKKLAEKSVFKFTAQELLASYYIDNGKIDEAKKILLQLSQDNAAPLSAKERAGVILKTLN